VVRYEQKEFAEFLIDKGVNVNVQGLDGNTPLDWAVYFKKIKIAELLRKHGGKTGEELKAEGK
jgi:ankyrin repeat protein